MSPSLRAFLVVLGLLGATEVVGQEAVTALDRHSVQDPHATGHHLRRNHRRASASIRSDDDSVWKAELYGEG